MSFWKPNIDNRGRIIRAIMTIILFAAAYFAFHKGVVWLAVILAISGIVGVVETVRGWCVLRACKIKTRF
ncbi:MAG: YgaP-like transmembrane domain [Chthoniobacteraceae bacterium]